MRASLGETLLVGLLILILVALLLTGCHSHHSTNPRRASSDHGQWHPTFKHRYVPTAKDYLHGLA